MWVRRSRWQMRSSNVAWKPSTKWLLKPQRCHRTVSCGKTNKDETCSDRTQEAESCSIGGLLTNCDHTITQPSTLWARRSTSSVDTALLVVQVYFCMSTHGIPHIHLYDSEHRCTIQISNFLLPLWSILLNLWSAGWIISSLQGRVQPALEKRRNCQCDKVDLHKENMSSLKV